MESSSQCGHDAGRHHDRAGEHHRRRADAIRDPPTGRPRDHRGQRGRADEQPERGGVLGELRQDPEDGAERGVTEDGGTEDGEVGGAGHVSQDGARDPSAGAEMCAAAPAYVNGGH